MTFGMKKCNTIIENDTPSQPPSLNGKPLKLVNQYKYLGVISAKNDPYFLKHASQVMTTTKKKSGILSKFIYSQFNSSPKTKIQKMYKQIIRPTMEYAQQVIQYNHPTLLEFEKIQIDILKKALRAGKPAQPEAIRLLTTTERLEFRWASLKEIFIKKTISKDPCYEKSFLESSLKNPDSRMAKILKKNNIFPNLALTSRFSQIKQKWKKISFIRDKNSLNSEHFPILANIKVKPRMKIPFWLGNPKSAKKIKGRSTLVNAICTGNPRPWELLKSFSEISSFESFKNSSLSQTLNLSRRKYNHVKRHWDLFLEHMAQHVTSAPSGVNGPAPMAPRPPQTVPPGPQASQQAGSGDLPRRPASLCPGIPTSPLVEPNCPPAAHQLPPAAPQHPRPDPGPRPWKPSRKNHAKPSHINHINHFNNHAKPSHNNHINHPKPSSFFSFLSDFFLMEVPREPDGSFRALDSFMQLFVCICKSLR